MRKTRKKTITAAMMALGVQTTPGEVRRAKEHYERGRRGEPCGANGHQRMIREAQVVKYAPHSRKQVQQAKRADAARAAR